jgi:hypothetical protein
VSVSGIPLRNPSSFAVPTAIADARAALSAMSVDPPALDTLPAARAAAAVLRRRTSLQYGLLLIARWADLTAEACSGVNGVPGVCAAAACAIACNSSLSAVRPLSRASAASAPALILVLLEQAC